MEKNRGVWAWVSGEGRLLSLRIGEKVGRIEWFKGSGENKKGGHSGVEGEAEKTKEKKKRKT